MIQGKKILEENPEQLARICSTDLEGLLRKNQHNPDLAIRVHIMKKEEEEEYEYLHVFRKLMIEKGLIT